MEKHLDKSEFVLWIKGLKSKIHDARRKVAFSVNSQVLELYWDIGKDICDKQEKSNWGSNLIEAIEIELRLEFPEMKGFSRRNLYAIRQWHKFYSSKYQFVPQCVTNSMGT